MVTLHTQFIRTLGLATAVLFGSAFIDASAQPLNNTQWLESLSMDADGQSLPSVGIDDFNPENFSNQMSGATWSLDGSLTFGPPGAPTVTTQVNGSYQSGLNFLGATSYVMVSFEFRLVQTSTPPVTITSVPLTVRSRGTADTGGDPAFLAIAFAFLDLASETIGPLASFEARASNDPNDTDPNSDSFDQTKAFSMGPTEVAFGSMAANAHISAEVPQGALTASAQAFIDPVIVVSNDLIPGTSTRYNEVFGVEFSDGYFALGDPTSVTPATWSDVKSIYTRRQGQ